LQETDPGDRLAGSCGAFNGNGRDQAPNNRNSAGHCNSGTETADAGHDNPLIGGLGYTRGNVGNKYFSGFELVHYIGYPSAA